MIQTTLLREFREIEEVEVSMNREVGPPGQSHYVFTGITLTACGIQLGGLNERLEKWMALNNVNECGNISLQVTESEIKMKIRTLADSSL
jgi:hypothetical protein